MAGNPFSSSLPFLNGASYGQDHGQTYAPSRDSGIEPARDYPDDQLDQVRDLLFGELQRSIDARLQTLEARLQTLEHKVDQIRHETHTHRAEHIDALAHGIDELSRHVRSLTRR